MQYKTSEMAARCAGLIRVNVYKDKIKNAASLPPLPNQPALVSMLAPSFLVLSSVARDKARSRPIYAISESQRAAAQDFLSVCFCTISA